MKANLIDLSDLVYYTTFRKKEIKPTFLGGLTNDLGTIAGLFAISTYLGSRKNKKYSRD